MRKKYPSYLEQIPPWTRKILASCGRKSVEEMVQFIDQLKQELVELSVVKLGGYAAQ
ncbi:MAG: hypothetical protein DSM106950_24140 [Stigonema ocellatum SAG 48.90 = DSM 106950]|nr:hypothetical protein [Stigonema ocellatum SAG 48.90 = DSM 106950]